jgi:membrane-bound serine protease (ClpP class)
MTNSPVPVIGFVEPPTAQATSAGAFLLLATDVAAMAPGTRVGAAHPVGSDKNLEGAMEEKATNSLVSLAKSLATRHNRPESYAESIVRKSASFTAEEAKTAGAVRSSPHGGRLARDADGYAIVTPIAASSFDEALNWLRCRCRRQSLARRSESDLASIPLSLGVLDLYELVSGHRPCGYRRYDRPRARARRALDAAAQARGFVLLLAGFVSIAVEVKSPAHGALALGGVVALILGALVLVDETGYFGGAQKLDFRIFVPFIVVVSGSFLLFAGIAAKALRAPAQSGLEMMRGMAGVARTRIGPDGGMVFVEGSRWQAASDAVIEPGEEIVVEEVTSNPTRLRVKATEKGAS